jgi:prepilin-type N-terminal cleavage/methylation domain-containing protein
VRLISAISRRARDHRGFTLIELLVGLTIMLVLLGAVGTALVAINRQQPNDVNRTQVIGVTESGLATMTRELRMGSAPSGTALPTTSTSSIDVLVPNSTYGTIRVKYDCTVNSTVYTSPQEKECVRYWSSTLTSSPTTNAKVVIDGISNDEVSTDSGYTPVFTPNSATSPDYYAVKIEVPARGTRASAIDSLADQVTLTDGFYLFNADTTARGSGGQ